MSPATSAGKRVQASHDWFWFYFSLVEKVARVTKRINAKPTQLRNYFRHSIENRSTLTVSSMILPQWRLSRISAKMAVHQRFLLQTAEHFLEQNGFSYNWEPSGALCYWQVLPAFQKHPETGDMVWFNQIQSHHASHLQNAPRLVL